MRSDTVPYEKEFRNSIKSIICRASRVRLDELKKMSKGIEQYHTETLKLMRMTNQIRF